MVMEDDAMYASYFWWKEFYQVRTEALDNAQVRDGGCGDNSIMIRMVRMDHINDSFLIREAVIREKKDFL